MPSSRIIGAVCHGWYKVLKKYSHSRVVWIILVSICIFLTLYTVSIKTETEEKFNAKEILGPAFALLQDSNIDDIKDFSDMSSKAQSLLLRSVRKEVERLVEEFSQNSELKKRCVTEWQGKTILTLFTTWVYDKDKFEINNKTLYNWKKLPNVKLIVFSNDKEVKHFSSNAGWDVYPVVKEADNAPMLSAMYKEVMSKIDSVFYGYANGDLLFTNNLVDTLQQILCKLKTAQLSKSLLIVGKRTNVQAKKISYESALSWSDLTALAESQGTLFQQNALDYFITNRAYPWDMMLPLVVGRRGYDNWVVAYGLYNDMFVIDATETVLCVHQTLESRGNYEGLAKGDYNMDLIRDLNVPFSYSKWGETDCAKWKTWYNMAGKLILDQRKLKPHCTEYFRTNRFWQALGFKQSDELYNVSKAL